MRNILVLGWSVLLAILFAAQSFANCEDDKGSHDHAKHASAGATHFGEAVPNKAGLTLAQATSQYSAKTAKQPVVIEAQTTQVCKKMGCWLVLKEGDLEVRAVMKGHAFSVPQEILGKKVRLIGQLDRKEISAAQRRHFAKDGGAKAEEIQKITTSEWTYQFTADGVQIL